MRLRHGYPNRNVPEVRLSAKSLEILERAKGFEPSTPTLARLCSTPELHPHPRRVSRQTGPKTRAAALLCQRATGLATLAKGANPLDRRGGLDRLDAGLFALRTLSRT